MPDRSLWGPLGHPEWESLDVGNWIRLVTCPSCNTTWCTSPYEPYASFHYAARWAYTIREWRLIHDIDDGATMRDWLTGFIHDHWRDLPTQEQSAIQKHDSRAYGHSPIHGLYSRSVLLDEELADLRDI